MTTKVLEITANWQNFTIAGMGSKTYHELIGDTLQWHDMNDFERVGNDIIEGTPFPCEYLVLEGHAEVKLIENFEEKTPPNGYWWYVEVGNGDNARLARI